MVALTFNDCDPTSIIKDLLSETSSLVGNKLPGDPVHRERNIKVNKGSRDKVVDTRRHALGAS
jgi:hypothetical protein